MVKILFNFVWHLYVELITVVLFLNFKQNFFYLKKMQLTRTCDIKKFIMQTPYGRTWERYKALEKSCSNP